jgi:penicillin-binding protein 1A
MRFQRGWALIVTSVRQSREWSGSLIARHRRLAWWGVGLLACAVSVILLPVVLVLAHVYDDRSHLPDPEPFARFEFLAIGHVYDANGRPLVQLAREHRSITRYEDIPVVVRNAILATEDKRFFEHNGVDYSTVPRVLSRIRGETLVARLFGRGPADEADAPAIFPQGGSTITQQLVRGHFLKGMTSVENSYLLQGLGRLPRSLSFVLGARNANMIARKAEEMRLSLWIEEEMTRRFGSKQKAKEEIFARYASYVYMGNGQYGFATASQYYLGQRLESLTPADADKAALLAGIPKSPRDYAPTAPAAPVLRRRNQTLTLMAAGGLLTEARLADALRRPLPAIAVRPSVMIHAPSAIGHVIEELRSRGVATGLEDLLSGRLDVHSTVDVRVQQIVNDALERGLAAYEKRRPRSRGLVQGSVVVLGNGDARVLAEAGGRREYHDRSASYTDFNRATAALRQPGSTMKPIVYLAAFRGGEFDLESMVPDSPISVPDGNEDVKWIANYDGQFKGLIPARQALAESRNAAAIWIGGRIGIDSILRTARRLGVVTPLHRYPTTALGASEMSLLELANAYRMMASGVSARPYVIARVARGADPGVLTADSMPAPLVQIDRALLLIQEGLRGVVRMPGGTAHALDSSAFPLAVMGKTGTTNEFRDALFVGSTYGVDGITVAVRIGFDDNRSLGKGETGARLALPVFRDIMLRIYREGLAGPAPTFPASLEERITSYLEGPVTPPEVVQEPDATLPVEPPAEPPVTSTTFSATEGSAVRRVGVPRVPVPGGATEAVEQVPASAPPP